MKEIERKFLVARMPDLSGIKPLQEERYFLELSPKEKRITRQGETYIYEEKDIGKGMATDKETREIGQHEFEELKKKAIKSLIRTVYVLAKNPEISIKIYHGDFEGLMRAEFEFNSEEEATNFQPPIWTTKEITGTKFGRDGQLITLNQQEFRKLLNSI